MSINGQDEETKSLINEAVIKLVKGIKGIENLFCISVDDFEWTIRNQDTQTDYKVYFEKVPKEKK